MHPSCHGAFLADRQCIVPAHVCQQLHSIWYNVNPQVRRWHSALQKCQQSWQDIIPLLDCEARKLLAKLYAGVPYQDDLEDGYAVQLQVCRCCQVFAVEGALPYISNGKCADVFSPTKDGIRCTRQDAQ